ncbi:molybdopterin cofactor-binding domain-containing protein [Gallaecimonas pentaromativorans]|uniref:xanthine dehydrogenase family protein molybdopterin-binding subunit n=1 Tax=Gallaecimonas pentaromativorans TaxID=584787 RepID=UPI003A8F033D
MQPIAEQGLSRRAFLKAGAALGGGLMVSLYLPPLAAAGAPQKAALNAYISITPDGMVNIMSVAPEIGQGIKTSLPMIIADELDADWAKVKVQQAPLAPEIYGRQSAGGSRSMPTHFDEHRRIGATARQMLKAAAAKRWQVPVAQCHTEPGEVVHQATGRRLGYGQLASDAAAMAVPEKVALKKPGEFRLIGQFTPGVDNDDIVNGRPLFGIDVTLPGMLYAVYQKGPVFGAKVKSANLAELRQMPGVKKAFVIEGDGDFYGLQGGVAIVASSWWQAQKARRALKVEWHQTPGDNQSSSDFDRQAQALWQKPPQQAIARQGDVAKALREASQVVEADYQYPFVAHGQLEPINCTAHWQGGKLTFWAPTQNPAGGRQQVAKVLGMAEGDITVNVTRMGGGFGRRLFNDYMAEAGWIARALDGAPVKLLWSREDDFQHDYYRPGGYHRFRAALNQAGKLTALSDHFVSFASQDQPLLAASMGDNQFPAGFVDNLRYDSSLIEAQIPTGWLRAPSSNALAWVFQSILDEAAHAAGKDPLAFQMALLSRPAKGNNSFNATRMQSVLKAVAERSGWGRKPAEGRGLGFGCYFSHAGYFAEVVEASVSGGQVVVHKVWAVGDVGEFIVNPSGAMQQAQGAIIEGLSQALYQQVPIEGGAQVSNFHQHRLMSMPQVPEIDVHFLPSSYPTTGLGEPALPPVLPALCNALFAATGKRIRRLPIDPGQLS